MKPYNKESDEFLDAERDRIYATPPKRIKMEYGNEWQKEMMKFTKKDLIKIIKRSFLKIELLGHTPKVLVNCLRCDKTHDLRAVCACRLED